MIEIKKVVLGLLILYVAVFSGLFIKQAYKFNKQMNQKINFETKEYYEEFIKESRAKVQQYRTLSTTNEQLSCLNEVEKMIDISYKNQHPKAKTYIELMDTYYNKTEEETFYNYINVLNLCKLKEYTKDTREVGKNVIGNIAIIEESLWDAKIMYQINLKLEDSMVNDIALPSFDWIKEKNEQSLRDRVIRNEINLIEKVLELVGEEYE